MKDCWAQLDISEPLWDSNHEVRSKHASRDEGCWCDVMWQRSFGPESLNSECCFHRHVEICVLGTTDTTCVKLAFKQFTGGVELFDGAGGGAQRQLNVFTDIINTQHQPLILLINSFKLFLCINAGISLVPTAQIWFFFLIDVFYFLSSITVNWLFLGFWYTCWT